MLYLHAITKFLSLGFETLLAIGLLGGGVYLILFPPLGLKALQKVGIILTAAGAIFSAYLYGVHIGGAVEREACHEADLRAQLAAKERDLAIQKATAADAAAQAAVLAQTASDLQGKVSDYEATLSKRAACLLTPDDIGRLQRIR